MDAAVSGLVQRERERERRIRMGKHCVPVLKGATLPSLSCQKLSRWYSAYSGVVLKSLFGFLVSMACGCLMST